MGARIFRVATSAVEKVNATFNEAKIMTVCKRTYRDALLKRLQANANDPQKAFTGKNSLEKNPIWIDSQKMKAVPTKVKTVTQMTAISLAFFDVNPFMKFIDGSLLGFELVLNVLMSIAIWLAVIATIWSGIDYFMKSKDIVLNSK